MEHTNNNTKKVSDMKNGNLFALITGLAAGAVLGILFAPGKGEETRRKLREAFAYGDDQDYYDSEGDDEVKYDEDESAE